MALLEEYRQWQEAQRQKLGEKWEESPYVFPGERGGRMNPSQLGNWLVRFQKRHGLPHLNPPRLPPHHDQHAVFPRGGQREHQPPAGPQQRVHHHQHLQPRDAAGGEPHQRLHGGRAPHHPESAQEDAGAAGEAPKEPEEKP